MASWQDAPIVEAEPERPAQSTGSDFPFPTQANRGSVSAPLKFSETAGGPIVPGPFTSHDEVAGYWKGRGAPQHVAEGIADRVGRESGFRPDLDVPDKGGPSAGLYGAHLDRRDDLLKRENWKEPKVQHDWAYDQVHGGDPIATAHWEEILGAKTREEAARLWDKYFERSAAGPGSGWKGAPVVGSGNWNVSDKAIAYEQGRHNSSVRWMDPRVFRDQMTAEIEDNADSRLKRKSLMQSLDGGADVEAIPSLEVKVDGKNLKVIGADGRARAQAAIDAGVDLIPVAFHGVGDGTGKGDYQEIQGARGVHRFDFQPVPVVSRETSQAPERTSIDRIRSALYDRDKGASAPQGMPGAERVYQPPVGGFQSELRPGEQIVPQGPPMPAEMAPAAPPQRPTLMPFSMEGGFHMVRPEIIDAPMVGIQQAGQMMRGERPAEPTPELAGAAMLGAGLAPGSRAIPREVPPSPQNALSRLTELAPEGQNMLAAAEAARELPLREPRPSPITPERAELAQKALDRGAPLTAPEVLGLEAGRTAAGIRRMPWSGDAQRRIDQQRWLNRELAKEMGEDTPIINQQIMNDAKLRIGKGINQIEKNAPDMPLTRGAIVRNTNEIVNDAMAALEPGKANIIGNIYKSIFFDSQGVQRKLLSGETFGKLLRDGGPLDVNTKSADSGVAFYANRMKDALQDMLKQHLPPDKVAEYQELRYQYKVMRGVVEPLVLKEYEGNVSPALLNNAISKAFENRAFDSMKGRAKKLDDLGRISQAFLREPITSATSEQLWSKAMIGKLAGGAAAAMTGHYLGILPHELLATAFALGGARAATSMMARPSRVTNLIENALTRLPSPPGVRRNAINDLMSAGGSNFSQPALPPPRPNWLRQSPPPHPQQPPPIGTPSPPPQP